MPYVTKIKQMPGSVTDRIGDKSGYWQIDVYRQNFQAGGDIFDRTEVRHLTYQQAFEFAPRLQRILNGEEPEPELDDGDEQGIE